MDSFGPKAETLADGNWFCGTCHSLNRAGALRCYSCRVGPPGQAKSSKHGNSLLVILGLTLILILTVGVGFAFTDKTASPTGNIPASPVAVLPMDAPTEILLTDSPTPTAEPMNTPVIKPTIAPASPTVAPTVNPPPNNLVTRPAFPVSIPGVSLSYYNIAGSDGNTLLSNMNARGAAVCKLSEAAACFYDSFKWTYQGTSANGACKVSKVNFTAKYSIILPRWNGPARVPAALVTWWRTVFTHIVWHEKQHLAIARTYAEKYPKTILAGPCDQAGQNKLTNSIAAQLRAAQAAFDARDHSWTWPPYNG